MAITRPLGVVWGYLRLSAARSRKHEAAPEAREATAPHLGAPQRCSWTLDGGVMHPKQPS